MPQYQQYPAISDQGGFDGQELLLYAKPTGQPSAPYITVYSTVQELLEQSTGSYLPLVGGTMLGPLTLAGDPEGVLQAVTKQYADGLISGLGNLSTLNAGAGLTVSGTELIVSEISDGELLANITGATDTPVGATLTAILDYLFSSTHGALLFRGATEWEALAPGTVGYVLTTDGTGADLHWAATGTPTGWPGGMATNLTATGTSGNTYATALQLSAGWNVINAVSGTDPAVILTADSSFPCVVVNKSGSQIKVLPITGGQIDSEGTNVAVALPALYGMGTYSPRGSLTQWDSS